MDATELCFTPATTLAAAIRARTLSPVEIVDAVLARVERLNPRLCVATERAWFLDLCARRDPVSHRFASRDPGWLVGIDLALQRRTLADLVALDALGAGVLELHDVFARELPRLDDLLRLAPPHRAARVMFCADRLAPRAPAVPMPDAGWCMVRGDRPLGDEVPFAVGRLAEH